jgi:hypothetical protein
LKDLIELPAEIAFDSDYISVRGPAPINPPRGAVSDGLEVAIPLRMLFPGGIIPTGARLAVFAYITYSGESGEITPPHSEDRIIYGGRYPADNLATNQRLFGVVPDDQLRR